MRIHIFLQLLLLALSCRQKEPTPAGLFGPGQSVGSLQGDYLQEASGLAASRKYPGVLWSHNDSGNGPFLFAIDSTGQLIQTYKLEEAINVDWEDLCIGYDQAGSSFLFIGDIGDNFSRRRIKQIYRIPEPNPYADSSQVISEVSWIRFSMEDGPRDMETLMYDPPTSRLYLVSKRESQVGVYELPSQQTGDTVSAVRLATLNLSGIVAGDISADGSEIVMKTIDKVYHWERPAGESVVEALQRAPVILNYQSEPQGESIALTTRGYFTLSEKSGPADQQLYWYARQGVLKPIPPQR